MRNWERECVVRLQEIGINYGDACELRRISMTLHRWHELECGDSNNYTSWCITRGQKNGVEFIYADDGAPYVERHYHSSAAGRAEYAAIPDRERGAQKRLAKIMKRYPALQAYVQGDPRGAALYILRPGDVPEGACADSCYNRGIAVYK